MAGPSPARKLARYRGFLTTEYIPVVFGASATCLLVFRPDVLLGV